jgi:hypothetical protein
MRPSALPADTLCKIEPLADKTLALCRGIIGDDEVGALAAKARQFT